MQELIAAFRSAGSLILGMDATLVEILLRSLQVSGTAMLPACGFGFLLGAWLTVSRFRGRGILIAVLNASMALPPVVIGLAVYLLLSRQGPLGSLGLLFTIWAMVIAQAVLIFPIVAALTRQVCADQLKEYAELFDSMGVAWYQRIATLLWETRVSLITILLAGFGRALAEVGAVLIVGGNIAHRTRVMTTAIALETSKGDLVLALSLGIILLLVSLLINLSVYRLQQSVGS